ncbi:hypothetical protein TD95_001167 [Thielaviopsis punctulata]|uniref:ER lumen protein-retaining receptor n=1 Tax=Thielaviopsis punctulata TaxID=72032 RepID=A0A0F4ZJZ2_9PEZI|nr:hypothetical protein TD95_001167 [Thielaviopsis punctulata]
MAVFNLFRVLGDLSHAASKIILISSIRRNESAEGVSLITQVFYAIIFLTRYTDIFQESIVWNLLFKLFYIFSSFYIIFLMQYKYSRTRELELSWKLGAVVFVGSFLLTPFVYWISIYSVTSYSGGFSSFLWDFSQILESVCVLPQLLLLRQTNIPTVIDSYYLVALGSYRALYVLNWMARALDSNDTHLNGVSVFFGIIQTILYADFFYVYYSRQRVKLRNGSIIDSDDMDRGWIINRLFGRNIEPLPQGDEENPRSLHANGGSAGLTLGGNSSSRLAASRAKWGSRGISISADDDTLEQQNQAGSSSHADLDRNVDPDAKMRDPDELAMALDDESDNEGRQLGDEDSSDDESPNAAKKPLTGSSGVRGGEEWRD